MKEKPVSKGHKVSIEAVEKTKGFFGRPAVKYSLLAIFILVLSYLVQYFVNKPDFGAFLSSDMDSSGNVYVLGVDKDKGEFQLTKVLPGGAVDFTIYLDKSNEDSSYSYRNVEADSKGNFYIVKTKRNLKSLVSDKSDYPISSESVMMYDTHGNYVKDVVSMDFSKYANPPVNDYIRKVQVINQKMTVVGCQDNKYDVITANPLNDESPKKSKTFTVEPSVSISDKSVNWVSDIAVLSTGRVFSATNDGKLWGMDKTIPMPFLIQISWSPR